MHASRHSAATMPVTQDQIDALNTAIADGVRQVTIGGETITYNTTDSLIRARDNLKAEMAAQSGTVPKRRTLLSYAGRGYHSCRGG